MNIEYKMVRNECGNLHTAPYKIFSIYINDVEEYKLHCTYFRQIGYSYKNEFVLRNNLGEHIKYYQGINLIKVKKNIKEFLENI